MPCSLDGMKGQEAALLQHARGYLAPTAVELAEDVTIGIKVRERRGGLGKGSHGERTWMVVTDGWAHMCMRPTGNYICTTSISCQSAQRVMLGWNKDVHEHTFAASGLSCCVADLLLSGYVHPAPAQESNSG
jgi:hypothetical protein